MILDIHGCALTTILANFYTTAKGAYPDVHVSVGGSCVLLEWGSHALSAWLDVMNGCGDLTITHEESEQSLNGGPDPLDTVVALIAEHITEGGYDEDQGEAPILDPVLCYGLLSRYGESPPRRSRHARYPRYDLLHLHPRRRPRRRRLRLPPRGRRRVLPPQRRVLPHLSVGRAGRLLDH